MAAPEFNERKSNDRGSNEKRSGEKQTKMVLDYYTDQDYHLIMSELPDIIKTAEIAGLKNLEPNIDERKQVREIIKKFLRDKKCKVYGGTALNEAIKLIDPSDCFYTEYDFGDYEFYTPTPIMDMKEIADILYKKGFKYVQASEAQHPETYTLFVNFIAYCDASYVPKNIYHGINTIESDGILYVHPHFTFIDQLRIFNDPLNSAKLRWEKTYKRCYKILKHYPFEFYNKKTTIKDNVHSKILSSIKKEFMSDKQNATMALISGIDAFNFYINHASNQHNVEQVARTTYGQNRSKLSDYLASVPYMELIAVQYREFVDKLYEYIKTLVDEPTSVTLEEFYPLFQFTGYSVTINYQSVPLVKIIQADGFCIPNIPTKTGYSYVSYQYLLMRLLICKFRAFLEKNKEDYFNYNILVSNLIHVRNVYLSALNIGPINNTPFSEFRVGCMGTTASYPRARRLYDLQKRKEGKYFRFTYSPESYHKDGKPESEIFGPSKHIFKNTSGNRITNNKNLMFTFDSDLKIKLDNIAEDAVMEDDLLIENDSKNQSDNDVKSTQSTQSTQSIQLSESQIGSKSTK